MAIVLVVFLVVFAVMAAAIVSMSTSGARGAGDHAQASAALFMAESGIEWAARVLFDGNDPPSDCSGLQGQSQTVNDGGGFTITSAEYLAGGGDEPPLCRVQVTGANGPTRRVVSASIPIGGGEAAEGSIFDDPGNWSVSEPGFVTVFPGDGRMRFNRNQGCGGPDSSITSASPGAVADMLAPGFGASGAVYLLANFDLDTSCGGSGARLRFRITHSGGTVEQCDWIMTSGVVTPAGCLDASAPPALTDQYDLVIRLGADYASSAVSEIRIASIWEAGAGNGGIRQVEVHDACIGTASSCMEGGLVDDDPVDEGSWDETP
jgi:hypothetical protein